MTDFSDDWDHTERWKSSKIWDYLSLLDVDKWFHTKHRWHRSFANIMFYSGIFHTIMILNYYIGWALYYSVSGDTSFP